MSDYVHGGEIYNKEIYLDFSVNTNPLGLPKGVREILKSAIDQFSLYPDPNCTALKEAIGKKEKIDTDYIICTNGASDLIFRLCLAKRPSKSLVLAPTFSEYEKALKAVGSEILYYNLKEETGYEVKENILENIKEIDMLFLCNPNNPVGNVIDGELLRKIARRCKKEQILLVMDECFLDFIMVEDGQEDAGFSLIGEVLENKYIFLIKAFTKFYAMAGLRLGYGIGLDKELIKQMDNVGASWSVSIPAQLAGTIACEEVEYVELTKALIKSERAFLSEELKHLGLKVFQPRANYILFKASSRLYDKLLNRGILIRQCGNYRGLTRDYYRIAVRNRAENEILIKNIGECLTTTV